MPLPRMTLRKWMVVIAMLAPLFLAFAWLDRVGQRFNDTYRRMELEGPVSTAEVDGLDLNQAERFAEAEDRLRSGLELNEDLRDFLASRPRWRARDWSGRLTLGLAVAVAGQGRSAEAESLYREACSFDEASGRSMVFMLDRYSAILRQQGRIAEANRLEARARSIR